MDFLKRHLIKKIESEVKEKSNILGVDTSYAGNHLWLDNKIHIDTNRVLATLKFRFKENEAKKVVKLNNYSIYLENDVNPYSFYSLKGDILLELLSELKDKNYYVYKKFDNKSHKVRFKRR